ncbi:unnamed protein product [Phytomonas sp. EM1]|nr:unnamed protein product [Phytomonas sp. EM1]|eukprot:CCW62532.1 unnamed protein product [Phytomonas sp. isolate EM1]
MIPSASSAVLRVKSPQIPTQDPFSGGDARIFEELLDAEAAVDLARLREASRLGVHPRYRGMVYRYLLCVTLTDKSSEMSVERAQERDFELLRCAAPYTQAGRLIKGTGGKPLAPYLYSSMSGAAWKRAISAMQHRAAFSHSPESRRWLDTVLESLQAIYSDASEEAIFILVQLVLPFKAIKSSAKDTFYCVNTIYHLLTHHGNPLQDEDCLQQHCGNFMMLFHTLNGMLYRHFFTEGITTLEWVPRLLCTLLADRLHLEDLLRIWDYYLTDPGETLTFSLHPFVCLALLSNLTEDLVDCDKREILYRLEHMPRINAEAVLQKAISIREDAYTRGLLFS